ncbi:hypothetical protein P7K49_027765, partial [Saguinus oedipus]
DALGGGLGSARRLLPIGRSSGPGAALGEGTDAGGGEGAGSAEHLPPKGAQPM